MAASGGHWAKGGFKVAGGGVTQAEKLTTDEMKAAIKAEVANIVADTGVESMYAGLVHASSNPHISLDEIVASVDPAGRGQGKGTQAMNRLTKLADDLGLDIHLVADARTAGGKGTKAATNRLKRFYKKHGFRENKGRNYDFRYRGGMIRNPQ